MVQDLSNKEFSLKNTINRKAEEPSEQIFGTLEAFEKTGKEAVPQKEQKEEKIESEITSHKEQPHIQEAKEKVHTTGKASVIATQPSEEIQIEIKNIENILQEGLDATYKAMDPITRAQFKAQGEDTARAINVLMHKTKVKIKEIVNLIIKWLKLIPGVNKFFVEQEAKIKADKLMAEKRRKDQKKYEQK